MATSSSKSALVVGKGSIGTRHADVLESLAYDVSFVSRRGGEDSFPTIVAALKAKNFSTVILANETSKHVEDLKETLNAGFSGRILVEKPIFKDVKEGAAFKNTSRVFVGYNMRFNPLMRKLLEKIGTEKVLGVTAYVGQHLSLWGNGRPSSETYRVRRSTGGGVLRDLSHEIDFCSWLFGPLKVTGASGGRLGDLTVDAEDFVTCTFSGKNGTPIGVTLNYLDRDPKRTLTVHTKDHSYKVDFAQQEFWTDKTSEKFSFERNDSYAGMHRALEAGSKDLCDFAQGMETLALIEKIESMIGVSR